MRDALRVLHDPNVPADQVRASVYAQYLQNQLLEADRYITELASPVSGEEAQTRVTRGTGALIERPITGCSTMPQLARSKRC
jgi:hypothetical protein